MVKVTSAASVAGAGVEAFTVGDSEEPQEARVIIAVTVPKSKERFKVVMVDF
jgi:hypothetical protein